MKILDIVTENIWQPCPSQHSEYSIYVSRGEQINGYLLQAMR